MRASGGGGGGIVLFALGSSKHGRSALALTDSAGMAVMGLGVEGIAFKADIQDGAVFCCWARICAI